MSPNARPSENPVDIIDGSCKRKPSERSVLGNDVAIVQPKKAKVTTATGKEKPLVIRAATVVAKSAEKSFRKLTKSKSCMLSL
jgi:hypothetical protein